MHIDIDHQTLTLKGDFDARSTAQVRTALYECLGRGDHDVVIDLHAVPGVDVTALKVLAAASRWAARDGQRVTLRGCGPQVRRLLHRTRLMRMVELEGSLV